MKTPEPHASRGNHHRNDELSGLRVLLSQTPRRYRFNVLLNLIGGGAVALGNLVAPFLLARLLSREHFNAWVVAFTAVTYSSLIGNLYTGITVQGIAVAAAHRNLNEAGQTLSTIATLFVATALAYAVVIVLTAPHIAHLVSSASGADGPQSDAWRTLGLATAILTSVTVLNASHSATQRYEWDCIYKVLLHAGFCAGVWLLFAVERRSLEAVLITYLVAHVLAVMPVVVNSARTGLLTALRPSSVSLDSLRSIGSRLSGLLAWQVGMILVTGFDLLMTAHFDPKATGGYALALACVGVVSGLVGALLSPMLPTLSTTRAMSGMPSVLNVFIRAQRKILIGLTFIAVGGFVVPHEWWALVVPVTAIDSFASVLPILLLSTALRLSTALYSIALLAAGMQQRVVATPLLEGLVNLAVSYFLGSSFGGLGVALGTLAGALVCLFGHMLYNIPRTRDAIDLRRSDLVNPYRKPVLEEAPRKLV